MNAYAARQALARDQFLVIMFVLLLFITMGIAGERLTPWLKKQRRKARQKRIANLRRDYGYFLRDITDEEIERLIWGNNL